MSYLADNAGMVLGLLWEHAQIAGGALLVACVIALPLGVLIAGRPRAAAWVMGALGILYTVPSLALIILLVPLFGLSAVPVMVALILYAQVILVRNVVAGLRAVDPAMDEAARGMGMSAAQRWRRVTLPLALPVILAGVRIAAVTAIGIAAIGAKFSAGGLGRLLFDGIAQGRMDKVWAGAVTLAALAFGVSGLLLFCEKLLDARWRAEHLAGIRDRAQRKPERAAGNPIW
jgi:osmoprotectant transport system permease protein